MRLPAGSSSGHHSHPETGFLMPATALHKMDRRLQCAKCEGIFTPGGGIVAAVVDGIFWLLGLLVYIVFIVLVAEDGQNIRAVNQG
jgi:hypothetical protein